MPAVQPGPLEPRVPPQLARVPERQALPERPTQPVPALREPQVPEPQQPPEAAEAQQRASPRPEPTAEQRPLQEERLPDVRRPGLPPGAEPLPVGEPSQHSPPGAAGEQCAAVRASLEPEELKGSRVLPLRRLLPESARSGPRDVQRPLAGQPQLGATLQEVPLQRPAVAERILRLPQPACAPKSPSARRPAWTRATG